MARGRSAGYEDQRDMIVGRAAELFAQRGYPATSMNEVAQACGVSKPLIYHYFRDKYALLVDISVGHVDRLGAVVDEVAALDLASEARLRALIERFVLEYSNAQNAHRVLTEDVRFLEPDDRERVLEKERRVVDAFAATIVELRPQLDASHLAKPLTMLLFGMINWMFSWMKPDGPVSYDQMAPIVADLFFGGLSSVQVAAPPPRPQEQPTKEDRMTRTATNAWIIDGVRTPFGRYGGALAPVRTDDLAAIPLRALMERQPGVDWKQVDDLIYGCANQAGEDNRNVAHMASLLAGLPLEVPGTTVNRLCGSSLDAVGMAGRAILSGQAELVIAGGVESMTRAPFVMPKADSAFSRAAKVEDTTIGWRFVNPKIKAQYGIDSMPETAENVADEFKIGREDQDRFAWTSQQRCKAAQDAGFFAGEIVPVTIARGKGDPVVIETDEHPRPETTLAQLGKLKGVVRPDGSVTAGNASGVNDGSCALLIASDHAVERYGLKPRGRVVGCAVVGVPPRIMGIGPAPATRKLLEQVGWSLGEVDVIELNEAFAAQGLAVLRQLGLPDDAAHVNANGGAIALGHPLGASGARLVLTALRQLERVGGRRAIATMCIGVGQGIALAIERA